MIWATSNVIGLPASQLDIYSITQNATTKPSGGAMAAKIKKRVMLVGSVVAGVGATIALRRCLPM